MVSRGLIRDGRDVIFTIIILIVIISIVVVIISIVVVIISIVDRAGGANVEH